MRRGSALPVLFVAAGIVIGVAAQEGFEDLLVNDPRPMAGAVELVEQRCHCIVTYEDIRWRPDQIEDLPGVAPGRIAPRIPAGHSFMFSIRRDIASQGPDQIGRALQDALDAYERTNEAGAFRIAFDSPVFHVYPAKDAPLDVLISLPAGTRSLLETVQAILTAAQTTSGARIGFGTVPTNLMLQARITLEATNEPARNVLARALTSTGRKLSWRLLYDLGYDADYLNIHLAR